MKTSNPSQLVRHFTPFISKLVRKYTWGPDATLDLQAVASLAIVEEHAKQDPQYLQAIESAIKDAKKGRRY